MNVLSFLTTGEAAKFPGVYVTLKVALAVVVLLPERPFTVRRHVAFFFGAVTTVRAALSLQPPDIA